MHLNQTLLTAQKRQYQFFHLMAKLHEYALKLVKQNIQPKHANLNDTLRIFSANLKHCSLSRKNTPYLLHSIISFIHWRFIICIV